MLLWVCKLHFEQEGQARESTAFLSLPLIVVMTAPGARPCKAWVAAYEVRKLSGHDQESLTRGVNLGIWVLSVQGLSSCRNRRQGRPEAQGLTEKQ